MTYHVIASYSLRLSFLLRHFLAQMSHSLASPPVNWLDLLDPSSQLPACSSDLAACSSGMPTRTSAQGTCLLTAARCNPTCSLTHVLACPTHPPVRPDPPTCPAWSWLAHPTACLPTCHLTHPWAHGPMGAHVIKNGNKVTLKCSMYCKPSFRPHYLASMNCHLTAHKIGIIKSETFRALLCCPRASAFNFCLMSTIANLVEAGYPEVQLPILNSIRRSEYLGSSRVRPFDNVYTPHVLSSSRTSRKHGYMMLPSSTQATQLNLVNLFNMFVSNVVPIELRLALTLKPNAMRTTL